MTLTLASFIPILLCAALCLLILKALIETAYGCLLVAVGCLLMLGAFLIQALALMAGSILSLANGRRWRGRDCT